MGASANISGGRNWGSSIAISYGPVEKGPLLSIPDPIEFFHQIVQPGLPPGIPGGIAGRNHGNRQERVSQDPSPPARRQPVRGRQHGQQQKGGEPNEPAWAGRPAAVIASPDDVEPDHD